MKIVSITPIKTNSERVPGKNLRRFSDGTPLMALIQRSVLDCPSIQESYVYCSDESVRDYCLPGVEFLKRNEKFDGPDADINLMLVAFAREVPADVYVLANATAPMLTSQTFELALGEILEGRSDSALPVRMQREFTWGGEPLRPLNYNPASIPRTQDLPPVFIETTGFYAYTSEVILGKGRRIGDRPALVELDEIESLDINYPEDFLLVDAVRRAGLRPGAARLIGSGGGALGRRRYRAGLLWDALPSHPVLRAAVPFEIGVFEFGRAA